MGGEDTPAPTAYEKKVAEMAMKELDIYEQKMVPFRDKFIADVTRDTAIPEAMVAGEINADFAQASKGAVQGDPSLGTNKSAIPMEKLGRTQALATVSGAQAVRDSKVKGMQAGLDLVQGEATDANLGLTNIARDSVNQAISESENDFSRRASIGSAVGSAVGLGAALYKNSERT